MRILNARQKLFLRSMVKYGFYEALRIADYTKQNGYNILNDPKGESYLLSIMKETFANLGLTYEQLIKERLELARNPDTSDTVKEKIYRDLADKIEQWDIAQADSNVKILPGKFKNMLQPAKEIPYEPVKKDATNE